MIEKISRATLEALGILILVCFMVLAVAGTVRTMQWMFS